MKKIVSYKQQINKCGFDFLVEECHLDKEWLSTVFEIIDED